METTTVLLSLSILGSVAALQCDILGQCKDSASDDALCGETGVCQGVLIHTEDASTTPMCQQACANFPRCLYYTHDPAAGKCLMFETCPSLDESFCPDCVSGSPECEFEAGYLIMAIGGIGASSTYLDDIELVPLQATTNDVPKPNPLPQTLGHAAGALDYSDGTPFICGGFNGDYTDSCYKYVAASDEWQVSGTMSEERAYSGFGSSESWGLVMAGGNNHETGGNNKYLESVTTTDDGQDFGSLHDMPDIDFVDDGNVESCVVAIDSDRLFMCGGYQLPSYTFILSKSTNSWDRDLAPMPTKRYAHSCGLIAGPKIVVAGGQYAGPLDTVDIYSVDADTWEGANRLPKAMRSSAVVPVGGTFLLVGGYNGDYLADIYLYNDGDDEWVKLETELKTPRRSHAAVLVRQDLYRDSSIISEIN